MKRTVIESFEEKYLQYKRLGEVAIDQLSDEQLGARLSATDNSVSTLAWHLGGNLRSRFTDFLTSDGEKEWRDRDSEFLQRETARDALLEIWSEGWNALTGALAQLDDTHLERDVVIRGKSLTVLDALLRSLAHTSYHVGQMIFLAKHLRGSDWEYASIPPGGSAAYNANPTMER